MAEKDPSEELMKGFKLFDIDDKGKITYENLKHVAKELGENLTDMEIKEMFDDGDLDKDGAINAEEFMAIMKAPNGMYG